MVTSLHFSPLSRSESLREMGIEHRLCVYVLYLIFNLISFASWLARTVTDNRCSLAVKVKNVWAELQKVTKLLLNHYSTLVYFLYQKVTLTWTKITTWKMKHCFSNVTLHTCHIYTSLDQNDDKISEWVNILLKRMKMKLF